MNLPLLKMDNSSRGVRDGNAYGWASREIWFRSITKRKEAENDSSVRSSFSKSASQLIAGILSGIFVFLIRYAFERLLAVDRWMMLFFKKMSRYLRQSNFWNFVDERCFGMGIDARLRCTSMAKCLTPPFMPASVWEKLSRYFHVISAARCFCSFESVLPKLT